MPVLRLGRATDITGLREDARSGGGAKERLRGGLVVAEVALSVVLLVSAGLLIRALWNVQRIDPGFSTGVLTLRPICRSRDTTSPACGSRSTTACSATSAPCPASPQRRTSAGCRSSGMPACGRSSLKGEAAVRGGNDTASLRFISPDYFKTMGISLKRGRDVRESDVTPGQSVAVVSESFARRCWPGEDPIGRTFTMAFAARTVVGVVGDVRVRGLERTSEPQVYVAYRQIADAMMPGYAPNDLAVRTAGDPAALASAIRAVITRVDPDLPIADVRTIDQIVAEDTASRGVQLRVLSGFAALALLLAAVGINGLLSFVVSQRTQEIGVRIALGAAPRAILWMITRQATVLVVIGIAIGAPLAYAAGRAMQALLAGVSPADGWTFAIAIAAAVTFEVAGSLLPAIRASRVDPVTAIRG